MKLPKHNRGIENEKNHETLRSWMFYLVILNQNVLLLSNDYRTRLESNYLWSNYANELITATMRPSSALSNSRPLLYSQNLCIHETVQSFGVIPGRLSRESRCHSANV